MWQAVSKYFCLFGACVCTTFLSSAANATYNYYDWLVQQGAANNTSTVFGQLVLSPGAYDPFVIGEDYQFNACSTTFAGYSLCDLPDTSKFVIQWQAKTVNELGQIILYDSGVCNPWGSPTGSSTDSCLNVTVPGDTTSSVFNSDEFYIGIHIATYSNYFIPLPNGQWAYTGYGGQYGWLWTGIQRTSGSNGGSNNGGGTPVPEPYAPFLLAPAILFLMRRERKKAAY